MTEEETSKSYNFAKRSDVVVVDEDGDGYDAAIIKAIKAKTNVTLTENAFHIVKIEGSEVAATGHDWYLASVTDAKTLDYEEDRTDNKWVVELHCHDCDTVQNFTYYEGDIPSTVNAGTKKYCVANGLSVEIVKGDDCTVKNRALCSVDLTDDAGNSLSKYETLDSVGDHDFTNELHGQLMAKPRLLSRPAQPARTARMVTERILRSLPLPLPALTTRMEPQHIPLP